MKKLAILLTFLLLASNAYSACTVPFTCEAVSKCQWNDKRFTSYDDLMTWINAYEKSNLDWHIIYSSSSTIIVGYQENCSTTVQCKDKVGNCSIQ